MAWINQTRHTTPSLTWDESTFTWDQGGTATWDVQIINQVKHTGAWTDQTKHTTVATNQTKH